MNELLHHLLFDISKESENKKNKFFIKFLYIFNCGIITIWLAEELGYSINVSDVSYIALIKFISNYYILIPLFLFLFISFVVPIINSLFAYILSFPVKVIIQYKFFKNKPIIAFLAEQEMFIKGLNRGPGYEKTLKFANQLKGVIEMHKLSIEYYCWTLSTLIFIYLIIVKTIFPTLYFTWILVFSFIILTCNLTILAFIFFFEDKKKEFDKIVSALEDKTENTIA